MKKLLPLLILIAAASFGFDASGKELTYEQQIAKEEKAEKREIG